MSSLKAQQYSTVYYHSILVKYSTLVLSVKNKSTFEHNIGKRTHTHKCARARTHTHIRTRTHARSHARTHALTHMCIHIHVLTHKHVHARAHALKMSRYPHTYKTHTPTDSPLPPSPSLPPRQYLSWDRRRHRSPAARCGARVRVSSGSAARWGEFQTSSRRCLPSLTSAVSPLTSPSLTSAEAGTGSRCPSLSLSLIHI